MVEHEIVIDVNGVYKDFHLPHEKAGSVKGLFTSLFRSHAWRQVELQHALKDVSFQIKKGEFFGIVGRNGSGKSTLLKMLAGIYQPTKGSIRTVGKLIPFIELGVGFNAELTGRENVYLNGALFGFSKEEIDRQYDAIVEFAELEPFMDQKLKNYSSGMQVRLAFSLAVRAEADILLIDEVLAVGDADFQRKCFNYFQNLKKNNQTVVFVSHDMNAVREYCDRAILIEKSQLIDEGSPIDIASKYSRMFMRDDAGHNEYPTKTGKRWGDKGIEFTSIDMPRTIKDQETINIVIRATAKEDVEDPIFGFLLKNASGQPLMGTNSRIKRQRMGKVKAGDNLEVVWTIPNIFSDGQYFVDPAIVRKDGVQVMDWWEEAAAFTVYKEDRTPYIVTPNIKLSMQMQRSQK